MFRNEQNLNITCRDIFVCSSECEKGFYIKQFEVIHLVSFRSMYYNFGFCINSVKHIFLNSVSIINLLLAIHKSL